MNNLLRCADNVLLPPNRSFASKQTIMTNKQPLLPLVADAKLDELNKENSAIYLLRTQPADNASPTYKVAARILYDPSLCECSYVGTEVSNKSCLG